jgi:hypothetical protein
VVIDSRGHGVWQYKVINPLGGRRKILKPVADTNRLRVGFRKVNQAGKAQIELVFDAT